MCNGANKQKIDREDVNLKNVILHLSDNPVTGGGVAQLSHHLTERSSRYNCHCLHCKQQEGQ